MTIYLSSPIKKTRILLSYSNSAKKMALHQSVAERTEFMKSKINEAREMIRLKKKETKDDAERCAKAKWAICLCNSRVLF